MPGIITGIILAIGRIVGESAAITFHGRKWLSATEVRGFR